jgi:hypothetical protein
LLLTGARLFARSVQQMLAFFLVYFHQLFKFSLISPSNGFTSGARQTSAMIKLNKGKPIKAIKPYTPLFLYNNPLLSKIIQKGLLKWSSGNENEL